MSVSAPDALLLIAPGCPHCARVLEALGHLVKDGVLGRLEVVNLGVRPEQAAQLGVRSVPWCRIGVLDLQGLYSEAELRAWAEQAHTVNGIARYCSAELGAGRLAPLERKLAEHPDWIAALLVLLSDPDTPMQVRIGASALLEAAPPAQLARYETSFAQMTQHADHRVRADACHLLARIPTARARATLQACLEDAHPEVREIAADGIRTSS